MSIKPGMTVFPLKFKTFIFSLINWLICLLVPTLTILFLLIKRAWAVGWFGFIVRILALIIAKAADKYQSSPVIADANGLVDP